MLTTLLAGSIADFFGKRVLDAVCIYNSLRTINQDKLKNLPNETTPDRFIVLSLD
jgi:hypothetical protein